ncbi:MAG: BMP family ABC transporter substrate-binding protein [Micrococcales bacterium]
MRKFAALALVLALTGCSAQEPAPTITPVSTKYCALSDSAGFDDDGLNRSVYTALQQLKVQKGAPVVALEVGDKLSADAGFAKLVEDKCEAVISTGDSLAKPTLSAAKANPTIRFVSVSNNFKSEDSAPNFVALTFNIYQAAFAAGYLAASMTLDENETAVLNVKKNLEAKKSAKAFAAGVARFNQLKNADVRVTSLDTINDAWQDVVFVIAGNSSQMGEWNRSDTGALKLIKLIGYGRDWYVDVRNKEFKQFILTSVVRNDVVGKVVAAVIDGAASADFNLTNEGVGLTPAQDLDWPTAYASAFERIVNELADGKLKVE